MPHHAISRRQFVETSTAISAAAIASTHVRGAQKTRHQQKIRLGVIGTGNRGTQVTKSFLENEDVEVNAICDCDQSQLAKFVSTIKTSAKQYSDFRELLARDDIDAVLIATPDHWHALQTIAACRAGKDVYVEKPLSVTVHEGRRMVEVARDTKRVVQVGTHRRSSDVWIKAIEMIHSGVLGDITMCQAYRTNNMSPNGIGKVQTTNPPEGLDWNMWLGPRPFRPYQSNITPYKFRWWSEYSSQFGNWGVHYFDVMRWALNEQSPVSVCTLGGNYSVRDDRTIPDTAQAVFEFNTGTLALFGTYEAFGNSMIKSGEFEIRGTNGTLYVDSDGVHIVPEHRGQFQAADPQGKQVDIPMKSNNHADTVAHTRNFLDCIKSREKPVADVEIGHRSTTMSLLANISLQTKKRLNWNADSESFDATPTATELLHYQYRKPWSLDG
jgi:predicted dehydrogenase